MTDTADSEQLINGWVRHDWREVMTAPGLCVIQALAADGATASGAGDSRDKALARCLSETAEANARAAARIAEINLCCSGQVGMSAHPRETEAKRLSTLEAHERAAVWSWWLGQGAARRLPEPWLQMQGFAGWLIRMRQGAIMRRETDIWLLDYGGPAIVAVGRSQSLRGQDPILGFGAGKDTKEAVSKALRETLLMEMNLCEVLAARSGLNPRDIQSIEAKIANYALRCPSLLGATATADPPTNLPTQNSEKTQVQDITPPSQYRRVWACEFQGKSPVLRAEGVATPFM